MGYPDENTYWVEFESRCQEASGSLPLDWGRFRYAARAGWDIGAGMDPTVSADKHVAELKVQLRVPLSPAEQASLNAQAPGPSAFPYPDEVNENHQGPAFWEQVEAQEAGLYKTKTPTNPDGVPVNWAAFRWVSRIGFDIANALSPETSRSKHMRELTIALGIVLPFPVAPTRGELLLGQTTQQGLTVHTTKYGDMPWWGACWPWLDQQTRDEVAPQLLANGDTILLMELPDGLPLYDEPGQFYSVENGFGNLDMTSGGTQIDQAFVDLCVEGLQKYGFKGIWVFLGGDASAAVAIQYTRLLGPALANCTMADLNDYVVQVPGWDGVWHSGPGSYSREELLAWSQEAKGNGAKYIGAEHGTGYPLAGKGNPDFLPGGVMAGYDMILGEFNDDLFDDSVWQILARYLPPGVYVRPPEQPSGDDPPPHPYYLADTAVVYRVFEFWIYGWVRNQTTSSHVAFCRGKFNSMGAQNVC